MASPAPDVACHKRHEHGHLSGLKSLQSHVVLGPWVTHSHSEKQRQPGDKATVNLRTDQSGCQTDAIVTLQCHIHSHATVAQSLTLEDASGVIMATWRGRRSGGGPFTAVTARLRSVPISPRHDVPCSQPVPCKCSRRQCHQPVGVGRASEGCSSVTNHLTGD